MEACFITPPAKILYSPVPNSRDWIVRGDGIKYYSVILSKVIWVEPNFITDLGSIPRPLWWLYPPSDWYDNAVAIHDNLFWFQKCSFGQANRVLQEAMLVLDKTKKFDAAAFYHAVSIGSRKTYEKYGRMSDAERETGFAIIHDDGSIEIPKIK